MKFLYILLFLVSALNADPDFSCRQAGELAPEWTCNMSKIGYVAQVGVGDSLKHAKRAAHKTLAKQAHRKNKDFGLKINKLLRKAKPLESWKNPSTHDYYVLIGIDDSEYNKLLKSIQNQTYSLSILTQRNAKIEILNIKQKYKYGIKLPKGTYKIKISKKGYKSLYETITLDSNTKIVRNSLTKNVIAKSKIVDSSNTKFVYKNLQKNVLPKSIKKQEPQYSTITYNKWASTSYKLENYNKINPIKFIDINKLYKVSQRYTLEKCWTNCYDKRWSISSDNKITAIDPKGFDIDAISPKGDIILMRQSSGRKRSYLINLNTKKYNIIMIGAGKGNQIRMVDNGIVSTFNKTYSASSWDFFYKDYYSLKEGDYFETKVHEISDDASVSPNLNRYAVSGGLFTNKNKKIAKIKNATCIFTLDSKKLLCYLPSKKKVYLYNAKNGKMLKSIKAVKTSVKYNAFGVSNEVFWIRRKNTIFIYNMQNNKSIVFKSNKNVEYFDVSPNGKIISDYTTLYDSKSSARIGEFYGMVHLANNKFIVKNGDKINIYNSSILPKTFKGLLKDIYNKNLAFNKPLFFKINLPINPIIQKEKALIKDEFETTKAFKQRIELEKKRIREVNINLVKEYNDNIIKVQKANIKLENGYYKKMVFFKGAKNKIYEKSIKMAANLKYGKVIFKSIQYDADKELFDIIIVFEITNEEKQFTIPIQLKYAKKFKKILNDKSFEPIAEYIYEKDNLIVTGIRGIKDPEQILEEKNAYKKAKDSIIMLESFQTKYPKSSFKASVNDRIVVLRAEAIREATKSRREEERAEKERKRMEPYLSKKYRGDRVCRDGRVAFIISMTITAYVENIRNSQLQLRIADTEGQSPRINGETLYNGKIIWDYSSNWYKCD